MSLRDKVMKERLLEGNPLLSDVFVADAFVAIDGQTATLVLSEIVESDSEIHFIPAISGGF